MIAIRGAFLIGTSLALALSAAQKPDDAASEQPAQRQTTLQVTSLPEQPAAAESAPPGAENTRWTIGGPILDWQQLRPVGKHPAASPAPRSRYQKLLRTIPAPDDRKTYGDFCDFGFWSGTSYAGKDELPPGYWVYLAPNWYVFQESTDGPVAAPMTPRPWGPEQATGNPDTWPQSGDLRTAWASQTPDGQREWLELTYDTPIRPAAAMIYETYNPGAVDRVTGYDASGKEVELWSGADPTPAAKDKGISVIPLHPDFDVKRIRVYLDSPKAPGWNEIDAVGLVDENGKTHWAKSVTASSTYADVIGNDSNVEVETDVLSVPSIRLR